MFVREMHSHTLLLVDSSSKTEHEIRSAFAGEPIEVLVVENGRAALEQIEAHRPDVVLASTTALDVDGYGVAEYVSQRPHLSNVVVLLLTADVAASDTRRMNESGARGFVQHPLEPGVVVARVKEVLHLSEPELPDADVFEQLTTAFDAIDESMTSNVPGTSHVSGTRNVSGGEAPPGEDAITPEVLARIVNDAVTNAIAAYERARSLTPTPEATSTIEVVRRPTVVPLSPWRREQQRLQRDLGIDDIEFAPTPPVEEAGYNDLSAEMGVHEFRFEDAPSAARETAPEPAAAWPSAQPETDRRMEESVANTTTVLEALRDVLASLGTALADQASRIRSAVAERRQRRGEERTAAVTLAEPAAPVEPAAPADPADPEPGPEAKPAPKRRARVKKARSQ